MTQRGGADVRVKIQVTDLTVAYRDAVALRRLSLDIYETDLLTIMGPTASGKTTLLRTINRLNDIYPYTRVEGRVTLDSINVYDPRVPPAWLRKVVGMVFALPVPLPMSIYDNVAYGPRLYGRPARRDLTEIVERSLRGAALWDEVKDRLADSALRLSGGQQQRLCLARTLAVEPEVILLDEPCSGLDPISTLRIEELLLELKERYTVVLVTHNPQQAARVGGDVAVLYLGELVERGPADRIFTSPKDRRTEAFISGRIG
jgi:phosphate transport system ATP-binding protein